MPFSNLNAVHCSAKLLVIGFSMCIHIIVSLASERKNYLAWSMNTRLICLFIGVLVSLFHSCLCLFVFCLFFYFF